MILNIKSYTSTRTIFAYLPAQFLGIIKLTIHSRFFFPLLLFYINGCAGPHLDACLVGFAGAEKEWYKTTLLCTLLFKIRRGPVVSVSDCSAASHEFEPWQEIDGWLGGFPDVCHYDGQSTVY